MNDQEILIGRLRAALAEQQQTCRELEKENTRLRNQNRAAGAALGDGTALSPSREASLLMQIEQARALCRAYQVEREQVVRMLSSRITIGMSVGEVEAATTSHTARMLTNG